jgi:hypothetical protein
MNAIGVIWNGVMNVLNVNGVMNVLNVNGVLMNVLMNVNDVMNDGVNVSMNDGVNVLNVNGVMNVIGDWNGANDGVLRLIGLLLQRLTHLSRGDLHMAQNVLMMTFA